MRLTRRGVIGGALAAATVRPAFAAAPETLHARPAELQLAPADYPVTKLWTYDGLNPGTEIRVRRGDRVRRRLANELPEETTVHWHGIRIDNAMDGVPDLTQAPAPAGGTFDYDFVAPDAGTYWYHSHVRSWEQVARGLHGPLIVEEAAPPEVDAEHVLVLDDWRLDEQAQLHDSFGALGDWSHAGRIGNFVTVNGLSEAIYPAPRNARLRLRLINAANARIFTVALQGLTGWIVALDGQPLEAPVPAERVSLAPAQRADLIVDVTEAEVGEAFLVSLERDGGYALAGFPIDAPARPAPLGAPQPLPPNDLAPAAELDGALRRVLTMAGGAMGSMTSATFNGVETGIRDLAQQGRMWAFNGVVGLTETPFLTARTGETVRIAMTNDTRWPHAMHLHGHHFRRVGENDALGPWRDTLLMQPAETAEIAFVADNPGDWLLHCHMLEHAAAGMSTWIRVG